MLFYFTDYVSGGELFTHLYQREHFTEDQVRIYIGEIILALGHLHKVRKKKKNYKNYPNFAEGKNRFLFFPPKKVIH